MGEKQEERFGELCEIALKEGAKIAKAIPTSKVVIDERVRLKCEVPRCSAYNQYLTCPPRTMSIETFSRRLLLYKWSLLVQVKAHLNSSNKAVGRIGSSVIENAQGLHRPFRLKLLSVVEAVEADAFKKGMRFATGLTGGSCVLCEKCVEDKSADACRFPFRARPAMEGVGVDVFQTTQNAGLAIHLSSSDTVMWTGLILLE